MPAFLLTARNNIPLGAGQMVEKGRQIQVFVNSPCQMSGNIFVTPAGKEAVARAFAMQGIPASSNYMNFSKWNVEPYKPSF
jgi:hypothetical protein